MKKLMTLVALLAVGAWFAGCGESTPPVTKTPTTPVNTGAPAGHKAAGDKAGETEEDKTPAEGTEAAGEEKAGEEKPADEAAPGEEKAPE